MAKAGGPEGRDVFTFKVDEDGLATFDLNDQLDHPPASGDDAFLTVDNLGQYVQVSVTDGDGDTASATFDGYVQVEVENDVPELVEVDKVPVHYVAENGVYNFPTTVAVALDPFVTPGADEPLSYYWAPIDDDYDTGLASQGLAVQYAVNEGRDLLTAYTEAMEEESAIIFNVTLNSETGQAEFELTGTLDHSEDDRGGITLDFGQFIEATDADGDYVTMDGLVKIGVIDDPSSENGAMMASNTAAPDAMMAGTTALAFSSEDEQENSSATDSERETDQEENSADSGLTSLDTDADGEPQPDGQSEKEDEEQTKSQPDSESEKEAEAQAKSQSDSESEEEDEAQTNPEEPEAEGQEGSDGEGEDGLGIDFANEGDLVPMDGGVEENTSLA